MNIEEHLGIIYAIMQSLGFEELHIHKKLFSMDKNSPSLIISYDTDREEYIIKLKKNIGSDKE